MTKDKSPKPAGQGAKATNAEQIRDHITPRRQTGRNKDDREQIVRSLQLGLAVHRHQMRRSLTHAFIGALLSLTLLIAAQGDTATRLIACALLAHIGIQFFDFHRSLGYYNRGVIRLNQTLREQVPAKRDGVRGLEADPALTAQPDDAENLMARQRKKWKEGEAASWFASLSTTETIDWPKSDESTSLSTRARVHEDKA